MSATRIPAASLQQSIEQTVRTGQLGTIVSLRIFMSVTDDADSQLAGWLSWATTLFGSDAAKLFASRDVTGRQTSVLCSLASGATISMTAVLTPPDDAREPTLQLLLIGQHGIARLQGGDEIDATLPEDKASSRWRSAIEGSLTSQKPVECV